MIIIDQNGNEINNVIRIEHVWDLKERFFPNKICGMAYLGNSGVSICASDMEDFKKKAIEYFGKSN